MNKTCVELEQLVDRIGLRELLAHLEEICFEKAEHIRANWQDTVTAKPWEADAKQIGKIVPYIHN